MIEELKIVQQIFGDMAGVGIWAIVAYFVYKLCYMAAWLSALWVIAGLIKWVVEKRMAHNLASAREEAEISGSVARMRDERDEWRRKAEECKHMYKILKEANKCSP